MAAVKINTVGELIHALAQFEFSLPVNMAVIAEDDAGDTSVEYLKSAVFLDADAAGVSISYADNADEIIAMQAEDADEE